MSASSSVEPTPEVEAAADTFSATVQQLVAQHLERRIADQQPIYAGGPALRRRCSPRGAVQTVRAGRARQRHVGTRRAHVELTALVPDRGLHERGPERDDQAPGGGGLRGPRFFSIDRGHYVVVRDPQFVKEARAGCSCSSRSSRESTCGTGRT